MYKKFIRISLFAFVFGFVGMVTDSSAEVLLLPTFEDNEESLKFYPSAQEPSCAIRVIALYQHTSETELRLRCDVKFPHKETKDSYQVGLLSNSEGLKCPTTTEQNGTKLVDCRNYTCAMKLSAGNFVQTHRADSYYLECNKNQ